MNNQELQALLDFIKYVPEDRRDETTNAILKAAADSISLEKIKSLTDVKDSQQQESTDLSASEVKFSQKEMQQMPRKFRQLFRVQGMTARVYRRQSNAGNYNYEIRLRTHGYNIYASSNNLEEAKRKFIDKLVEYEKYGDTKSNVPQTFVKFTEYFFDNFYSRKVAAETLRVAKSQFKNHLAPYFGDVPIRRIVPKKCQELYDGLEEQGKGKTAEDVFSLLNVIFKAAIKHAIITHNPLDMVFHTKHEREHGTALTKDEEKKLLTETAGTPYQLMFAVGLYTGMRPNEYFTAKIEGDFIVANNSKRKNGKVELKKIPITPMLRPYLQPLVGKLEFTRLEQIRNKLRSILPNHKLYDLRTTFYTRCTECGIAEAALKKFVGHTLGGLADTYTDLCDEFLLKEGQKFVY
ncbi:MAG: tyrosine-type recombinase/integrase [Candidatus Coproplasma sp.]